MNRLLEIGFQRCGYWSLEGGALNIVLNQHQNSNNILYAFICDGEVKYIGKTTQVLSKRMAGYKNPGPTQSTNIRNNKLIKENLSNGVAVDILALPDNGLMHYGQFHINLAAALEDDIISVISPEWNGGKKDANENDKSEQFQEVKSENKQNPEVDACSFIQELKPTYYNSGFFNVKVSDESKIAGDGERIDIYVGEASLPFAGSINRRCNTNGTPRIMGGIGLKNWFINNTSVGDHLIVFVLSPNSIRIRNLLPNKR